MKETEKLPHENVSIFRNMFGQIETLCVENEVSKAVRVLFKQKA